MIQKDSFINCKTNNASRFYYPCEFTKRFRFDMTKCKCANTQDSIKIISEVNKVYSNQCYEVPDIFQRVLNSLIWLRYLHHELCYIPLLITPHLPNLIHNPHPKFLYPYFEHGGKAETTSLGPEYSQSIIS